MTRKDCIRKYILGPEVRSFTITTTVLILILTIATFAIRPWRSLPLRVFTFAQIMSLFFLFLCKTLHSCRLIDQCNLFMTSYTCCMICLYLLITICGFLSPEIYFGKDDKRDRTEDYAIRSFKSDDLNID